MAKPVIPALFATIHFRSPSRPDGYTDAEIVELNRLANLHPDPQAYEGDGEEPVE